MITLVIGGSCSGKSEYSEALLDPFQGRKYYIATMKAADDESLERVRRHRERRAGRSFQTIECPVDLAERAKLIPEDPSGSAVLLECIGNLAANEFFRFYSVSDWKAREQAQRAAERILAGVRELAERSDALVIVSNEVNRAGCDYAGDTLTYQKLIGMLNQELCAEADRVVEMVSGCPVVRKES